MLAQLALTRDLNEEADAIADKAIEATLRMNAPIFIARALVQEAAARRRLGKPKNGIRRRIDEALEIACRSGAGLIEQEATRNSLI